MTIIKKLQYVFIVFQQVQAPENDTKQLYVAITSDRGK